MLLTVYKAALCLLLFTLLFISIRHLGMAASRVRTARGRLTAGRNRASILVWPPCVRVVRHLNDMMSATRWIRSVGMLAGFTLILMLAGMIAGVWVFRSLRGVAILGAVLGLLPYLTLRLKLISSRLRTRMEFLPAVEVFYQQMVLTPRPNIRLVLDDAVSGDRLLYPIKPVFEQLHRNLSAGAGSTEDALRIFSLELGHVWADYFANMLRLGIQEGTDITGNLKELIEDMRRAQLYDQKARNRLLEIRLASFSPMLFLVLFIFINLKLNYGNTVRAYFLEAEGRNMLLHALLLQFASLLMGIYLSMKRM